MEFEPPTSIPFCGNVLIVDDEAAIRCSLGILLSGQGYRAQGAPDGEAGWEALRANRFDALITDHNMPRLTGLDLIRRVRAAALPLPVILISGLPPENGDEFVPPLPAVVVMKKPFYFVDLLAQLRSILVLPRLAVPPGLVRQ